MFCQIWRTLAVGNGPHLPRCHQKNYSSQQPQFKLEVHQSPSSPALFLVVFAASRSRSQTSCVMRPDSKPPLPAYYEIHDQSFQRHRAHSFKSRPSEPKRQGPLAILAPLALLSSYLPTLLAETLPSIPSDRSSPQMSLQSAPDGPPCHVKRANGCSCLGLL